MIFEPLVDRIFLLHGNGHAMESCRLFVGESRLRKILLGRQIGPPVNHSDSPAQRPRKIPPLHSQPSIGRREMFEKLFGDARVQAARHHRIGNHVRQAGQGQKFEFAPGAEQGVG